MSLKSIHKRRLDDYASGVVDRAAAARLTPADLRETKLQWYSIANQDGGDDGEAVVYVYDEIGGTFGVDAEQFARDLNAITAPQISVRINSPGGSLFDGLAIYNTLRAHPAQITAYVDSIAASIASIIALGGDEVVVMDAGQMMIHDAIGIEMGNAADMQRMSAFLDRQSQNLAGIYQRRAGGTLDEWRERMLAETWMFGPEAVELGLADRVEEREPAQPEPEPDLDAELEDLMSRTFNLGRYRYAGREAAPPPDAPRNKTSRPPQNAGGREVDDVRMARAAGLREALKGAFA